MRQNQLKPSEARELRKTLTVRQIAKLHGVDERTVYSALVRPD